jgi:hypothetical protein
LYRSLAAPGVVIFRYKFSSTGRTAWNRQLPMAKADRIAGAADGADFRSSLREHSRRMAAALRWPRMTERHVYIARNGVRVGAGTGLPVRESRQN